MTTNKGDLKQGLRDALLHVEGLFVGQLNDGEIALFNLACREGAARASYEGGTGFMGLARVRLVYP